MRMAITLPDSVGRVQTPAKLDEPVGVCLDKQGQVYVTDTWNQRVAGVQTRCPPDGLIPGPGDGSEWVVIWPRL